MGRLGLGDEEPRQRPCLVGALRAAGSPLSHVAAGAYHSAAVCCRGRLWTWGAGVEAGGGQPLAAAHLSRLGHCENENRLSPAEVGADALGHARVEAVAAGSKHTLALTDTGTLVSFGRWSSLLSNAPPTPHTISSQHLGGCALAMGLALPPLHALAFVSATHPRLGASAAPGLAAMSSDLLRLLLDRVRGFGWRSVAQ
jgi:hypothetical protein